MVRRYWTLGTLAAMGAVVLVAYAGDAVKLNVKLGLWEVTTTGKSGGEVPEELLAQVPPERRAQMIAMLKASANQTRVYRECMTADKLSKGFDVQSEKEGCKRTVVSNTTSDMVAREQCNGAEGAQNVEMHFHADSTETVTGTVAMALTRGGHTMTVDHNLQGKWLGASCGNVKDVQTVK